MEAVKGKLSLLPSPTKPGLPGFRHHQMPEAGKPASGCRFTTGRGVDAAIAIAMCRSRY